MLRFLLRKSGTIHISLIFAITLVISWISFASLSYATITEESKCIINVNNFNEALLFSIETGVTIGYGTRVLTRDCPAWFFALWIGYIIQIKIFECMMCGLIFLKFSIWIEKQKE